MALATTFCSGQYATSLAFASFWCLGSLIRGYDDSGGAANVSLQDLTWDFVQLGIEANVGMILYNMTAGTDGEVTAVTANTMTATGVTWDDGDEYQIVPLDGNELAMIDMYLDITANDIHAALGAQGMCGCTPAPWALAFLAKLNIIEAAIFYNCPCAKPKISDDMRQSLLAWATNELSNIRMGKIELCAGETGAEFPYTGYAEQGTTEFAKVNIIVNDILRNG
jgi:hypothetical protein